MLWLRMDPERVERDTAGAEGATPQKPDTDRYQPGTEGYPSGSEGYPAATDGYPPTEGDPTGEPTSSGDGQGASDEDAEAEGEDEDEDEDEDGWWTRYGWSSFQEYIDSIEAGWERYFSRGRKRRLEDGVPDASLV
jgi:hypothetical protein